jgi:hypothetical protein
MARNPLAHLNPTDPAELAAATAYELVRAAVAVANLCDERREGRGPASAEMLVDELSAVIAERLAPMMQVYDSDDVNTMILHVGEAIDAVGFGDSLDMRDVWVFRRWADPNAFVHREPQLDEALEHARADLLAAGVVVLADETHRGDRTISASGPTADATRTALAEVVPLARLDWVGPGPRRLRPTPCIACRPRDGDLRVWLPLRGDGHVDEILVAEDDERVVVLAIMCTSEMPDDEPPLACPYRVVLAEPLGDREVIDGATGEPIPRG